MRIPAFIRYWTASATGSLGTALSTVAIQVLVVEVLVATPAEVGVVNAARVLPYALFGVFAGVLIDRVRRKPLLVWSNAAQAVVLLAIPTLWLTDMLSLLMVAGVLFVVGALSVLEVAARQSFIPRLVPRSALLSANARIDQGDTVALTSGPALGGGLVALVGAPLTVLVDAVTCVLGAVMNARVRVDEPALPRRPSAPSDVVRDIADGVAFVYRHRTVAPHAVSTHVWFAGNAVAVTAFAPFALREMGLGAVAYGILLAFTGVGGLIGSLLAVRAGRRLGAGGAMVLGVVVAPVAWGATALSPPTMLGVIALGAAQLVAGFGMGVENANSLGYRQAVTPDEMQGRMNATIRSVNRTCAVVGALTGGLVAQLLGLRSALWVAVALFVVATAVVLCSPLRSARHHAGTD
ncbi:putative MFS family arabinose efflux permease [Nocardioides albertanoniae]|uniref:Putative MFS family arabinose efflux permease n=2 Tax=Nocardioides albertanoniae TaxID=1175486 RepID=A0A543A7Q7_9ACTN|nr:putative MFS family arabinose efflux permease [Nocardioides albertanoniae]